MSGGGGMRLDTRLRVICGGCLTPRAHDVPAAGCALFGVVLCRKGRGKQGEGSEW